MHRRSGSNHVLVVCIYTDHEAADCGLVHFGRRYSIVVSLHSKGDRLPCALQRRPSARAPR